MSSFVFSPPAVGRVAIAVFAAATLTACSDGNGFGGFLKERGAQSEDVVARASTGLDRMERDVEAPDVFKADEDGLWDGRPSLGGIWVAHPEVTDPERVMIRNRSNDKFVVGALFRRERDIPGPRLQISSDAAEALGVLAGSPVELEVVALRKEELIVAPEGEDLAGEMDPATDIALGGELAPMTDAPQIETASLDPLAAVDAALQPAEPGHQVINTPAVLGQAPAPAPKPAQKVATAKPPAPAPAAPTPSNAYIGKPFLQIGIFSQQKNAKRAADMMRNAGMVPTVKTFEREGTPFWRVVVGPAATVTEREDLMAMIKEQGFADAYAVTN